ncbi:hypothetical protein PGTUg99_031409 [Puccinia graminis f. sp. tritici]|uniref:Uncharacterized protein n=1 Tax=Puccinia graminis f. sp. tritici TaxID=56615 RepID=A0A5B0SLZ5_PUCGR|nr:hypothetical protein PGTUg99_031409 [Puccinia graminis f. sp. tritici]
MKPDITSSNHGFPRQLLARASKLSSGQLKLQVKDSVFYIHRNGDVSQSPTLHSTCSDMRVPQLDKSWGGLGNHRPSSSCLLPSAGPFRSFFLSTDNHQQYARSVRNL